MKLFFCIAAIAIVSAACATIRPVARNPEIVWVEHSTGEVLPLARPSVVGDTIVGTHIGSSESLRVALPQVRSIYARQPDRKRTVLLVAATTTLAAFIVWRSTQSGGSGRYCFITSTGEFHCVN